MRILLVGCSGFVGRALVPQLLEAGHSLTLVSRAAAPLPGLQHRHLQRLQADPADAASWQQPGLKQALAQAEAVVNLAGEPIAEKRWTPQHLQLLSISRIATTGALVAAVAALPEGQRPGVLINGSAIGYYGTSSSQEFREASPAGSDVLGRLCAAWEAEARAAEPLCRVVILRIGIVLGADGGALGKMLPVFRLGFGGPIGDGQQWMSWIARADLCSLIATALAGLRGAVPVAIALQAAASDVPWGNAMPAFALAVVLLGLVLQGSLLNPVARRLGLVGASHP